MKAKKTRYVDFFKPHLFHVVSFPMKGESQGKAWGEEKRESRERGREEIWAAEEKNGHFFNRIEELKM